MFTEKTTPSASSDAYKMVKICPSDKPFLILLKIISRPQYDALMLTQQESWTSYKEFAHELQWPVNTFKTRLHRARRRLLEWRAKTSLEQTLDPNHKR